MSRMAGELRRRLGIPTGRDEVRRRPGGRAKVRRRRIQKAKTKPEKKARVRRRLNEGRRFDESHKGREGGSTKAKGFDEG